MLKPAIDRSDRMSRAGLVGAIVAAFAASACCLGPAILAIVGVSGVGFASALEPYRPVFLGVTAVLLGVGFYASYRKPRALATGSPADAIGEAPDACGCEMPRASRAGRKLLWGATVLAVVFAAYPYAASALSRSSSGASAVPDGAAVATVRVDGMTCRSCSAGVVDALAQVAGVVHADIDYDAARARVTYDPSRVQPEAFVRAIDELGYTAQIVDERAGGPRP